MGEVSTQPDISAARRVGRIGIVPIFALAIVSTLVLVAIFADIIAPHSPITTSLPNRLQPPAWVEGGSHEFLLGTDRVGRDILSRIIFGARATLLIAVMALLMGAAIGAIIGIISGFFSGTVDNALMRVVDVTLSLPIILIALLFVVIADPAISNVIIAISLVLWAQFARVLRGEVLSLRERDFVALARIAGASNIRIMARHIFPNVVNTLIVMASLQVGWVIMVEAILSFLGAGVPPPTPVWGSMIADGRNYVTTAWWMTVFPGLTMMVVILAFNLLGEWLRDALDPRLRQL